MMKNKTLLFKIISIIIDVFIIGSVISCVINCYTTPNIINGNIEKNQSFRYFTIDSNVLIAVSSLFMVVATIFKKERNKYLGIFNFVSTCQITLTMITVIAILVPFNGFHKLYAGRQMLLHLILPLLKLINCLVFQNYNKHDYKSIIFGYVPYLIYATIYVIEVLVIGSENGGWIDIYGFTKNLGTIANSILMTLLMTGIILGLYFAIKAIYNKSTSKEENS